MVQIQLCDSDENLLRSTRSSSRWDLWQLENKRDFEVLPSPAGVNEKLLHFKTQVSSPLAKGRKWHSTGGRPHLTPNRPGDPDWLETGRFRTWTDHHHNSFLGNRFDAISALINSHQEQLKGIILKIYSLDHTTELLDCSRELIEFCWLFSKFQLE